MMVGTFDPITCSGYDWLAEVLQYTEYPVMIPFLGIGADQLADIWDGEPATADREKFWGDDGTVIIISINSMDVLY